MAITEGTTDEHQVSIYHANTFLTEEALLTHAQEFVLKATWSKEVIYEKVPPSWGACVVDAIITNKNIQRAEVSVNYNSMTQVLWILALPTELHLCVQKWFIHETISWLSAGHIKKEELDMLHPLSNIIVDDFNHPYSFSCKQSSLIVRPRNQHFPTILFESGWSESRKKLHDDMALWLRGGRPEVRAVIILTWTKGRTQDIMGFAEVYICDGRGIPVKRQSVPIYRTRNPAQNSILLTRWEVFGSSLPSYRAGNDVFRLSLDALRDIATDSLIGMRLV